MSPQQIAVSRIAADLLFAYPERRPLFRAKFMAALPESRYRELSCAQCRSGAGLDFDFSFAFQPVVNANLRSVVAYEALVRGPQGEPAPWVLKKVSNENRYAFDQACRVKAIALATDLKLGCRLNINFFPNAIYKPELCIRTTLEAAKVYSFPVDQITFEFLESEHSPDIDHLRKVVESYNRFGFKTAMDDFGTGHSNLNLLADFQPDIIKIDRQLIKGIEGDSARQIIVKGVSKLLARWALKSLRKGWRPLGNTLGCDMPALTISRVIISAAPPSSISSMSTGRCSISD